MKKRRARRNTESARRKSRRAGKHKGAAHIAEKRTADRGAVSARGVHLSIQQAAEEFGHNWATIQKRIRELGIEADGERQGYAVYRLKDLLALERSNGNGSIDPEKLSPFEQAAFYKAVNERLKAARETGATCLREDVEREWARILRLWAHRLAIVTDEIERDIGAPAPVMEALEHKLDAMREGLYEGIVNGDDAGTAAVATAAPGST